jgi:ribonuclease HI
MFMENGIICFFDGACEPRNPGGNMGIGAIIFIDGKELSSYSQFIPANKENSNNVAEYLAFEWVLQELYKNDLEKSVVKIYGDSKLVVNQMKGYWKIKVGYYVEHAIRCKQLLRQFDKVKITWVPRERNMYADKLSKGKMLDNNVEFKIQKV